ncbi:hypothetical protein SAMN05192555_114116 [Franzmannia pantelleriensis]|uniref:PilX N-terminal n=1 Tax=Franzmannia pantelleriensis TaxID=48727 RepID=A0A1G9U358_9GAMM|nr:hypothetical protein [Halomonas pantelleriensis]SDM54429.1 hypothetical protein SAMN05192555_114116 [Halomonas pantelleriensis]
MKNKQRGMTLIVSLTLMSLALVLGVSGLQSARVEETAAGSNRSSANAQMAAEFGASQRLTSVKGNSISSLPACSNPPSLGETISVSNAQDSTVGYQHETCRLDNETARITSRGLAGDLNRTIQVVYIDPDSSFLGLSALNFPAQVNPFSAPSSNSFIVEGAVEDSVDSGSLPAISTAGQQSYIESQIGDDRIDNYSGGISNEISESILTDAAKFSEFVESLKVYAADTTANGGAGQQISSISNGTNLGNASAPMITYVTGDASVQGNASGAGILIVDGDYGTSGTPGFDGLIIVLGDTFGITGGGNGGLSGALILAPMEDSEDGEAKQFSDATVSSSGGGNASYSHDAEALSAAFNLLPESLQLFWRDNNQSTNVTPGVASWIETI